MLRGRRARKELVEELVADEDGSIVPSQTAAVWFTGSKDQLGTMREEDASGVRHQSRCGVVQHR